LDVIMYRNEVGIQDEDFLCRKLGSFRLDWVTSACLENPSQPEVRISALQQVPSAAWIRQAGD